MRTSISALAFLGLLTLTACGGSSGGPGAGNPAATPFTSEHAWRGPLPEGAETIDPAEFQRRVASGELVLVNDQSQAAQ